MWQTDGQTLIRQTPRFTTLRGQKSGPPTGEGVCALWALYGGYGRALDSKRSNNIILKSKNCVYTWECITMSLYGDIANLGEVAYKWKHFNEDWKTPFPVRRLMNWILAIRQWYMTYHVFVVIIDTPHVQKENFSHSYNSFSELNHRPDVHIGCTHHAWMLYDADWAAGLFRA